MRTKSVAQVQKDLQVLANQFGAEGFDAAKANYFKSVTVENDAGELIDPSTIEVEITFAKAADQTKASDIADLVSKTVKEAFASEKSAVQSKAIRVEAVGDERRKNVRRGTTKYLKNPEVAHDFGRWLQAVNGNEKAAEYCRSKGVTIQKAPSGLNEGINVDGGFLVPDQFDNEIVVLREAYGVFRRNARIKPMSSDVLVFSRQTSSHTAYFPGESNTNTVTKTQYDQLKLIAEKCRIDGYMSREMSEDAAVAIGDEVANDIAYLFSLKEDQCGFLGDGTATYGSMFGLGPKLLSLNATPGNIAGLFDASTSDYATLELKDFHSTMAKLPAYARGGAKWYCHSAAFDAAMQRLAYAAGGAMVAEVKNGVVSQTFLGHPVEFAQVLPATATAGTIGFWFGDLSRAAYFGDRRGTTFETTNVGGDAWAKDETAYKATQRFGINCANLGNASATASDRVAGPIVGLYIS